MTEAIEADFAEGLKHMLASLYSHTGNNVLSSTMAAKLLADEERFMYSHDFKSIPLKHLIEWSKGNESLDFKLKTVKNSEGEYQHVQDMFINNVIYRPYELENLGCYDIVSQYELRKMPSKKLESGNILIESNNAEEIESINIQIIEEIETIRRTNLEKEFEELRNIKNKKGKIAAVFKLKESVTESKKSEQQPTVLINPDTKKKLWMSG